MSSETLRAGLYALGATLVGVAEFDEGLLAAGIQADYIPDGLAKILLAVGVFAIGWAKTNRFVGDFSIKDVVGSELKAATEAKQRDTMPGNGPVSK